MQVPSAYAKGYEQARLHDAEAADHYVRHTTMGDAELDPIYGRTLLSAARRTAPVHPGRN